MLRSRRFGSTFWLTWRPRRTPQTTTPGCTHVPQPPSTPGGSHDNTTDTSTTLTYEVFVNEAPRQDNGLLPNGEPKMFSPLASTLIYGARDAVLTDPGMTVDQARISAIGPSLRVGTSPTFSSPTATAI